MAWLVSPRDAGEAVNLLNVSIMAKHLLLQGKCQYLSVWRHTKHLPEERSRKNIMKYTRKIVYILSHQAVTIKLLFK